ncbi:MAG TPA: aldehyde dehydrogenase family protein [Vicinamibacterales bacterium]|jgi:alpha-ketoglutaric semialdehyde dehydrogenase|nr:aldehyde dehydrogenase family protein [Vicinamibacterales bacterium]
MPDTFKNFVAGQWKDSNTGQTFENENPANKGSNLGFFQSSGTVDIDEAVSAAELAFRTWRRTAVAERQQYVAEFLRLLKESREELARVVTLENGKTLRESRAEVDSALVEGNYHLTQVSAFYGHTGPGAGRDITTWVQYEPLGVVGVISPWNFPMNVMCRKTLPALLTGNTVVFKPASFTPWSGIFMARLFERAGLPAGVFNCLTGLGSSIGSRLVEDPRVRAISFTGSTAVGKKIQAQAAANLTRTQLELGGKNALIVMADADVDATLDAAVTAGFSNAGQWCTSTSRILLQRSIAKPFLEKLVARCEKMNVGDGLHDDTDMGPVAGPQQYQDIRNAICRAQTDGARMIAGGDAAKAEGYFIRPTVFTGVRCDMELFREEIFGPVLAISEFESLDEALKAANDSIYGLSSAIYTSDLRAARKYIDGIEAGLAHVNVHTGYKEPSMPFGGVKQSGAGLPENSESGLEAFVNRKAVYLR